MRAARLLAVCLLAALYLRGLAPSVHVHDAGELTAAAWTLGIGHPPGSPLYMLLSKAFLLLVPLGSIAWRANLFSAAAAVGAFLAFDAAARRVTGRPGVALEGAGAFALSLTFWSQAEMAEVYTLQALLLLVFLWACVEVFDTAANGAMAAFLWGVLLACHVGLAPLTPFVLLLLARPTEGGMRPWARGAARLVPPLLLPLLLYAYVPLRSLRDPFMDWGNPESPKALWWYLTNRQVRGRMLTLPWEEYLHRTWDYLGILVSNLHILLPLALMGAVVGWKRRRPFALLLLLVWAADAGFVVLLDTAPLASEAYAIPSIAALALLAVWGASAFRRPAFARAAAGALACAAGLSLFLNLRPNDLHQSFLVRDATESLLAQTPHGATLFVQEDSTTNALAYLCGVEGARSDLEIFDRFGNLFGSLYDRPLFTVPAAERPAYRREREGPAVEARLSAGQPVAFSTPFLEYAPGRFTLSPGAYASQACLLGAACAPLRGPIPPPPRAGDHPDWMSRQILAELATRRAETALAAGSVPEAREALSEAVGMADLPELFIRAAQLARRAGEGDLAMRAVGQALSRAPSSAPALSLKGALLLDSGRSDEGAQVLRAALEVDPSLPQPYALLGTLAARRGEWGAAREAFNRSLERDPRQPDLLHDRALAALAMDDRATAEADFREALGMTPTRRATRLRLVHLLLETGRSAEARDILCGACAAGEAPEWGEPNLRELLLLSAQAGFPPCMLSWLERSPFPTDSGKALAASYARAVGTVLENQQR